MNWWAAVRSPTLTFRPCRGDDGRLGRALDAMPPALSRSPLPPGVPSPQAIPGLRRRPSVRARPAGRGPALLRRQCAAPVAAVPGVVERLRQAVRRSGARIPGHPACLRGPDRFLGAGGPAHHRIHPGRRRDRSDKTGSIALAASIILLNSRSVKRAAWPRPPAPKRAGVKTRCLRIPQGDAFNLVTQERFQPASGGIPTTAERRRCHGASDAGSGRHVPAPDPNQTGYVRRGSV